MNTQTNFEKIARCMMAAGVPTMQAAAITAAIEHAIVSPSYAVQYGTILVDELKDFVVNSTEQSAQDTVNESYDAGGCR